MQDPHAEAAAAFANARAGIHSEHAALTRAVLRVLDADHDVGRSSSYPS
jgi:hypothetical protein